MSVSLLATADLHIGSGTRYGRTPTERLEEQEQLWRRILEVADEEQVDALLVAGDVYEGPLPTPEQYLAFARPLEQAPCPVLIITGNGRHDAAMRDATALDVLNGVATVHSRPGLWRVPESDVTIATLPWAPVSRIVASENGGDRDAIHEHAAELLLQVARGLRAQIEGPAILLAHWSISGATLPGGMTSDQLREVVLPASELEGLDFDLVVAGHLHPPQLLDGGMLYVGSPMPLSFGETGDHGVWLLEGPPFTARFMPLESRGFVTLDYDYGEAEALLDLDATRGRGFEFDAGDYVKLRYTATAEEARRLDNAAMRQTLLDAGAHQVWVEPQIERPLRARVEGMDETVDDRQALDQWLATQDVNGEHTPALRELHTDYLQEVAR